MTFTEGGPGLVPKSLPVSGDVRLPRASMLGLASPSSPRALSLRECCLKPPSL